MPDLTPASLSNLQQALGYAFGSVDLLRAALVHTSYVNERPERALQSNERLEFLGDAVLGLVAAHRLYERRPDAAEGELTVLRAWLVRQSTLARWARQMQLGQYLLLGRGEVRTGGRDRPAVLARAFEALLGAVYLDGGLEATQRVLLPFVEQEIATSASPQRAVDAKSRLQQVCQSRFSSTPVYTLLEHSGPGHAPVFVFEVRAGPEIVAQGSGPSKRAAQQTAAHTALQLLDVHEGYELPEEETTPSTA